MGDVHTTTGDFSYLLQLRDAVDDASAWRPNAFIQLGDLSDTNGLANVALCWREIRMCRRPGYVSIGNHDEYQPTLLDPTNAATLAGESYWNMGPPFYQTFTTASGDGTKQARVFVLDANFSAGNRIGDPAGTGETYQYTAAQIAWVTATLAADGDSDFVVVVQHIKPSDLDDYKDMLDALRADGRPVIGFCGHNHGNATLLTPTATDGTPFNFYKPPAIYESESWLRVTLAFTGSAIVPELDVRNFHAKLATNGWFVNLLHFTYTDNVNESGFQLQEVGNLATVVVV